jgi:hypothetical protein
MKRQKAEELLSLADAATEALNKLLFLAKDSCSVEEFDEIRSAVAHLLVGIQTDVLKPVFQHYPDLDKFGYFRKTDHPRSNPPGG